MPYMRTCHQMCYRPWTPSACTHWFVGVMQITLLFSSTTRNQKGHAVQACEWSPRPLRSLHDRCVICMPDAESKGLSLRVCTFVMSFCRSGKHGTCKCTLDVRLATTEPFFRSLAPKTSCVTSRGPNVFVRMQCSSSSSVS